MQSETFIRQTVDWLNRRVAPEGMTVSADTRLFETGMVDSLGILRLIAWTEQAIGRQIQDREIRMDRFGSVRDIADNFLGGFAGGSAGSRCAAGSASRRSCAACAGCERRAA